MGFVRSTTEQEKEMKEVESWLLKNAISFGFLAKQTLLTVFILTPMEWLQTVEDQGATKIYPSPEHNYISTSICNSAVLRENMETVKFPLPNDHIQRLIREMKTNKMLEHGNTAVA